MLSLKIVALKLSGIRRNFEVDDHHIASLFKGLSHADIERVLRRAVKEMILSGREFLEKMHLDDALAREYRHNK
jgi:AAA+ superfamily predicted ATPase